MNDESKYENGLKLTIRRIQPSDSGKVYEWRNDAEVRKWSRNSDPLDLNLHSLWIENWIKNYSLKGHFFIIQNHGKSVGVVRLDMLEDAIFEVSVLVESDSQGKGIAMTAIELAFNELRSTNNLCTVIATVHYLNASSIKLFKNLGFNEIGKIGEFLQLRRDISRKNS